MHRWTSLRGRFRNMNRVPPIPASAEQASEPVPFFGVGGPSGYTLALTCGWACGTMRATAHFEGERRWTGKASWWLGYSRHWLCSFWRLRFPEEVRCATRPWRSFRWPWGCGRFLFCCLWSWSRRGGVGGTSSVGMIGGRCAARGRVLCGRSPRAYGDAKAGSRRGGSLTSFAGKCGALRMTTRESNSRRWIRRWSAKSRLLLWGLVVHERIRHGRPDLAESIVLYFIHNIGRHASGFPRCSTWRVLHKSRDL